MNAPHAPNVDVGVLLAGGSSQRAGVDKRFLVLDGRTLMVRNLTFLRDLFPVVAAVIGRGQSLDLGDGGAVEVLRDAWPGSSPLAGIATALAHFRRPVFALAVDIAFPRRDAAEAVIAGFRGHDASLPAIGHEHHQPLFAVYGPTCLEPMVALLESGRHRIVDIFASVSSAEVRFPDDSLFHNINTMSDYQEARMTARASMSGAAPAGGDQPALVAIVGGSHSHITALIETLSPELVKLGLRVGTLAWRSNGLEIGRRGDDQWCDGRPGGLASAFAAPERLTSRDGLGGETRLPDLARRFLGDVDLVVAAGFERTAPHRIEIFSDGAGHDVPLYAPSDALALVTDAEVRHEYRFALGDTAALARFIAARLDTLRAY
jgi:molybdopterin-guanine dinucleotide biosynthesis protein MobB